MTTMTIRINIERVTESKLVIYDEARNILFTSNITANEIEADLPLGAAAWFNIWAFSNGKWSIEFGGVPKVINAGLEINPQVAEHDLSVSNGVGTELKGLLNRIGITSSPTCSCNRRAVEMDSRGIEWCEQNIPTIVAWLREEAGKRGIPFVDLAGTTIVKLAIRRATKKATVSPDAS
jgi:hypothetical protein